MTLSCGGMIFSHRVNPKQALRFHALLIGMIMQHSTIRTQSSFLCIFTKCFSEKKGASKSGKKTLSCTRRVCPVHTRRLARRALLRSTARSFTRHGSRQDIRRRLLDRVFPQISDGFLGVCKSRATQVSGYSDSYKMFGAWKGTRPSDVMYM